MSYEISLIKLLEIKNKRLFNRLAPIKEKAEALLIYTQGKFPYYTPHSFLHSTNVEENLNWIIPDNVKETLNEYEIFFLIIAAWLHDWGMIGSEHEDPIIIREEHHIRTEQNFEQNYNLLNLTEHEAMIIGKICKGHRKIDLYTPEYDNTVFAQDVKIRIRLLSAILRLADECDITSNRTPEIIYYSINPTGVSEQEFKNHLSIGGIGQLQENHKIYINAIAKDPKGARALRQIKAKIQEELDNIKGILNQNNIPIDVIELKLETRGFIDKPIAFEMNKSKIVELLIGSHLYKDKDVAIRELVQNSIDSCKRRKLRETGFQGKVTLIKDIDTLIINDNGIGMNFIEAKQFLSVVGSSFYNSESFKELIKDNTYTPIAQFGIGLLSCFLIGKNIIIETLQQGEDPCKFSIGAVNEEWKYEKGSLKEPGTKITISLDENGKKISIKDTLYKYFISPEINIEFQDVPAEFENFQSSWSAENINRFIIEFPEAQIKERFYQLQSINTDNYDILFGRFWSYDTNQIILFSHGIFIGRFNLFGLETDHCISINLKNNIIDLQMSRENVIINEKWNDFLYSVFNSLFTDIEGLYEDTDSYIYNISKLLESRILLDSTAEVNEYQNSPFVKIFFKKAKFPIMLEEKLDYIDLDTALQRDNINVYTCCSNNYLEEISIIKKLLIKNNILFNPYITPDVLKNDHENIEYIKWLFINTGKTFSWFDFRNLLIENYVTLDFKYPKFLPPNIKFVKFPKDIKPLVVVENNAIVKLEGPQYLGSSYWPNILLWELLLDTKRQSQYLGTIKEAYNGRFDKINILKEQYVLVDASDDFVDEILTNINSNNLCEVITNMIYRYFKYLSYLPLAMHNLESCLIFIEVLDKLEYDISRQLKIKRPIEIFSRISPFSLYYKYCQTANFFDQT